MEPFHQPSVLHRFFENGKLIAMKHSANLPVPMPGTHWVVNDREFLITKVTVTPSSKQDDPVKIDCVIVP